MGCTLHVRGRRPLREEFRDWVSTVCFLWLSGGKATNDIVGCSRDIVYECSLSRKNAVLYETLFLSPHS